MRIIEAGVYTKFWTFVRSNPSERKFSIVKIFIVLARSARHVNHEIDPGQTVTLADRSNEFLDFELEAIALFGQ